MLRAWCFTGLAAVTFGLSFPLSDQFVLGWPLAFAWPALLALAARSAPRARDLAWMMLVAFFPVFLLNQWWMQHITQLGMPFLALYLAAWMAVLALLIRRLSGSVKTPRWPALLTLPVAVVSVEVLRGDLVCSGYAWFFAAHPLAEWTAVAQVAALGGTWLLSALVAAVSGGVLDLCVGRGALRVVSPVVAVALLLASAIWGTWRVADSDAASAAHTERANILIVQTNIPMSNKFRSTREEQEEEFLEICRQTIEGAKLAALAGTPIDLVLWPETTLPGHGLDADTVELLVREHLYPGDRYLEALRDLSTRVHAPLLIGSPATAGLRVVDQHFEWSARFNSAYLVGGDGVVGRTDKVYLTPFGEVMPIISNWDWLEERLLAFGADGMSFALKAASEARQFSIELSRGQGATLEVAVPICFEITMPWAARRIAFPEGARRAGVLMNLSNDGWFGPSGSGRRQYLQDSQLRAIELDTPVLRSANTGMSASIDRVGRIVAKLDVDKAEALLAAPVAGAGVPMSIRLGDSVAWGALALAVLGSFLPRLGRGSNAR